MAIIVADAAALSGAVAAEAGVLVSIDQSGGGAAVPGVDHKTKSARYTAGKVLVIADSSLIN
jgi:hypothetical protein